MEFNKPSILQITGNLETNFEQFKQEVKIYFTATETNKKSKEVQVARIKNLLGSEGLKLYRTLTTVKEEEETVDSIIEVLGKHCIPTKNTIMEIYKFFARKQEPQEPFERFYADLRTLVTPCEFGDQEEKLLKVQIVLGINSKSVQERLLREDITLEKVISFCKSVELAEKNMQVIEQEKRQVNEMKKQTLQKQTSNVGNNFKKFSSNYRNRKICQRCGKSHPNKECWAKGKTCNKCQKANHFANMCKTQENKQLNKKAHEVIEENIKDDLNVNTINYINGINCINKLEWYKYVKIKNKFIKFKLDSGAQVNIIPNYYVQKYKWNNLVKKVDMKLESYGGFKIAPKGLLKTSVQVRNVETIAEFLIVDLVNCTPILGLKTCIELGLLKRIDTVAEEINERTKFINENKDVFTGLGAFPDKCTIKIKETASPKAIPPRRIPLKIKDTVINTLKMLEEKEIIVPVEEPADWVHNMVIVEKPDKSLRICIDPVELNKHILREFYPIPTLEEISTKLAHKKYFSVLDLKDGFHQIRLDSESSKLCTFSTPLGLYKFLRAPFGITSIPEIFQKLTQKYFGNIQGVSVYFDDILCCASTEDELKMILDKVIQTARKYNIKFNPNKLQYFVKEIKYFGLVFNEQGMKPNQERIEVIKNLKQPTNK